MLKKIVSVVLVICIGSFSFLKGNEMKAYATTDKIYSTEKVIIEEEITTRKDAKPVKRIIPVKTYSTEKVIIEEPVRKVIIRENMDGTSYCAPEIFLLVGLGVAVILLVALTAGCDPYNAGYSETTRVVKRTVVDRVCEVCQCAFNKISPECCLTKCLDYNIFGDKVIREIY